MSLVVDVRRGQRPAADPISLILIRANASGAEIDSNWNYNGDLTGWSSTGGSTYNVLFFGNVAADKSIDADTRFTSSEPQHLNSNFDSLSPNGGNFMGLDGDPAANGSLEQTIGGLTEELVG